MTRFLPILFLVVILGAKAAADEDWRKTYPPKFVSVIDYMLKEEYPEVFNNKRYKIRQRIFQIIDINGDGAEEVIMVFKPHYTQSPSVVIFTVDGKGKVKRIKEGLAPGPLVSRNGEYIDPHVLGTGVDITPKINGQPIDEESREKIIRAFVEQKSRFVEYRSFFHMDVPDKYKGSYLDMRHLPSFDDSKEDKAFQFSEVRGLAVGKLHGASAQIYLVAWTGKHLTYYRIDKILPNGLLKKKVWLKVAQPDIEKLDTTRDGRLVYRDSRGKAHWIPLPTG